MILSASDNIYKFESWGGCSQVWQNIWSFMSLFDISMSSQISQERVLKIHFSPAQPSLCFFIAHQTNRGVMMYKLLLHIQTRPHMELVKWQGIRGGCFKCEYCKKLSHKNVTLTDMLEFALNCHFHQAHLHSTVSLIRQVTCTQI